MKVLFVCTGNTCRSPMAGGLAQKYLADRVEVSTAGIHAFDGESASEYAIKVIKTKGIDLSEHRASRLNKTMLETADYVLSMTKGQAELLKRLYPEYIEKIMSLGCFSGCTKEISDPWGGSVNDYENCAMEIEEMIKAIALNLKKPESRG